jgi:Leucine-rich repeat (LRR) protein
LNRNVHKLESLAFLKELTHLVICELNFSIKFTIFTIEEDTFKELTHLEHLQIQAEKGKWMRYLTNLKSLVFFDLAWRDNEEDVDYFEYLNNLGILKLSSKNDFERPNKRPNEFKALRNLKTLCLYYPSVKKITEEYAFDGLDELTELEIFSVIKFKLSLKSDSFKGLRNLRKLSVDGATDMDADFLHNFPNLLVLQMSYIESFELTEQTFSKNPKLKKLEISRCGIEFLPNNVFENLTNLTHLSLSRNAIRTFNEAVFNGLTNLIELNLLDAFNRNQFDMNVLTKMPRLKRLFIPDSKDFLNNLIKLQIPNVIKVITHT